MLARSATGSFRDALGTLEQLVTYGGAEVKLEDVLDILGVADAELVLDAAEALADHDPKARAAHRQAALRLGPRHHAVHARPLGAPAPPVRRPDARRGARLVLGHGRAAPSGSSAQAERISQGELLRAIDFLAAGARGGQGRLGAAHPAGDGAAEGHPAAGRPLDPGAHAPHRAARVAGSAPAPRQPAPAAPPEPPSRSRSPSRSDRRTPAAEPRTATRRARSRAVRAARRPRRSPSRRPSPSRRSSSTACWRSGPRSARRWPRRTGCSARRSAPPGRWRIEGDRLTVAFPADAAFVKKKAEANRDLVQHALRGLTGAALTVAYELRDGGPDAEPVTLDEAELIERLRVGVRRRRGLRRRGVAMAGSAQPGPDDEAGPADAGRDGQGRAAAEERGGGGERRRRHGDRQGLRLARAARAADRSRRRSTPRTSSCSRT